MSGVGILKLKRQFLRGLLLLALLFEGIPAHSRWFFLPGAYYTDELGIVGTGVLLTDSKKGDHFEALFEYAGDDAGSVGLYFLRPRATTEWTFNANFEAKGVYVYSDRYAGSDDEHYTSNRQTTNLWIRCDLPQGDGNFIGFQTSALLTRFKGSGQAGKPADEILSTNLVFAEGEEYTGSFRLGRETRNDRRYTTKGHYALLQVDLGQAFEKSDHFPLIRSQVDLRYYLRLYRDQSILALNLRGGLMRSNMPYFSQFKLGGDRSLRGFPVERYYGNSYYLTRVEYRQMLLNNYDVFFPIVKKLYPKYSAGLAFFTDMGDLRRDDRDWWGLQQGIGAGIRVVLLPDIVGSLDAAKSVDSGDYTFYFTVRQSF